MNFLSRPKAAVSYVDFRNLFRDTVLTVADVGPCAGRPKKTVLGEERSQMDQIVAARIASALVADMEKKGSVFEPTAQRFYEVGKRSDWAAEQINAMSATHREAEDEDPFRLVEKMCGELITIATRKNPITNSQIAVRITTASATPAELRIFADRQWKKSRRENTLGDKFAKSLRTVADIMADGERFDQAKARHYDNIRHGVSDEAA